MKINNFSKYFSKSKILKYSVYSYAGFLLGYIIGFLIPGITSPCENYFLQPLVFFHPVVAKYFLVKAFHCVVSFQSISTIYFQKAFMIISVTLPLIAIFLISLVSKKLSIFFNFLIFLTYGFYTPYIVEYGNLWISILYIYIIFFLILIYSFAVTLGKVFRKNMFKTENKSSNHKFLFLSFAMFLLTILTISHFSSAVFVNTVHLLHIGRDTSSIFIIDNATIHIFATNKTFFLIKEKHKLKIGENEKENITFFLYFFNSTKVKVEPEKTISLNISRIVRPNYGLWYESFFYQSPVFIRTTNDFIDRSSISLAREYNYIVYLPPNFQIAVNGKLLKPKSFLSSSEKRTVVYMIKNNYFQIIKEEVPFKGLTCFFILFFIFIILVINITSGA